MNELPTGNISHGSAPLMDRRAALLTGLGAATAVLTSTASAQDKDKEKEANPDLEAVRALLKAHDEALKNHDVDGVLKTFAEKSAVLGTGPGEIWSGHEEIKTAYENIFKGFDKGSQSYEYQFRLGGLSATGAWLITTGNVKEKREGKEVEFPINISITGTKADGKWLISALHYSTLTSGKNA